MLGYSTRIDLPEGWSTVEVVDSVAVIRDSDDNVLNIQHVEWIRKQDLPYEWDEPKRIELTSAMADVLDSARLTREQVLAMRSACDIALMGATL